MSRTIFRGAKRRGRRIPRRGARQFVAGHFVAVIGSRIFSRENTTAKRRRDILSQVYHHLPHPIWEG